MRPILLPMKPSNPLLEFLAQRQALSNHTIDIVAVQWVGGGRENFCYLNAQDAYVKNKVLIVSGWLALPYDKVLQRRQFTQHWWNFDVERNIYFDTSPNIEDGAIYIADSEIALFAAHNIDKLSSCVPQSVLFQNHRFFGLRYHLNAYAITPLTGLSLPELYRPYLLAA